MKAIKIQVFGHVQGVGFRYMTKLLADKLGVFGLVRNLPDGSVYIEAQGENLIISEFLSEVKKSPSPSGKVIKTVVSELPVNVSLHDFKVDLFS